MGNTTSKLNLNEETQDNGAPSEVGVVAPASLVVPDLEKGGEPILVDAKVKGKKKGKGKGKGKKKKQNAVAGAAE